ncbi:CGNR zinc finger domain-containing protein [Rheinheimera hassiensis]|uniref:CGNR zinc finger domain-containing protein n=1 Tax=Rheinheimera hassiensis TaxID=1193627 RepID=UPI001F05B670|nr:ABATE domain-containing protein [Rheinheimera hassiensis]
MAASAKPHDDNLNDAPMLGDHLAMDLLNTEARNDDKAVEYWHSDADVLRWLAQHNIVPAAGGGAFAAGELLAQAKALRSLAKDLISAFKAGKSSDISGLNEYLHAYHSTLHLAPDNNGKLALSRIASGATIASLLGPVAEAVAQLLVEANVELVKQCEHPDCILWFYDRTKAHKRRWCSMALCGNRYKAAQFRKRSSS